MTESFEYDIALSFAGTDRAVARKLARLLKLRGVVLFYDEYEEADLWGKDLSAHLYEVYAKKALYFIPLISKSYVERVWSRHEIKSALSRALDERAEYILPVKLDETVVSGLPSTIGYVDFREKGELGIADLCCQKLAKYEREHDGGIASNLRHFESQHAWELEGLDVAVNCPMCGGSGIEWVMFSDSPEKDICRMDCKNGKVTFFEFLQWMWAIYNTRRQGPDAISDAKVQDLVAAMYKVFQTAGLRDG